jgi:hypothetical protein
VDVCSDPSASSFPTLGHCTFGFYFIGSFGFLARLAQKSQSDVRAIECFATVFTMESSGDCRIFAPAYSNAFYPATE